MAARTTQPALGEAVSPPLPRAIQVEVTGSCNLRCQMCLVRYRPILNRVEGSMSFETFKAICDDLPELSRITLQGLGEPLLAPDLYRMIEYAAARGIDMGFNTNATLLSANRAERLIKAGLAWLHVSVDGATAETYESIRDGSNFQRVAGNIRTLTDLKRSLGAERPTITLVFVAMRRNLHELPELVRLAAGWGIERMHVQNLSHSFDDTHGAPDYVEIARFTAGEALWSEPTEEMTRVFEEARAEAKRLGMRLRLPKLEEHAAARRPDEPGCFWPFDQAYITHDGKVQPCCMVMGEDRAILGDARADGFAAVWNGPAYREFRAGLLGDEPPEVCRGCSMYRGVF